MDYDEMELIEIAYEIFTADEETAQTIKDTLNDSQYIIVMQFIERLIQKYGE